MFPYDATIVERLRAAGAIAVAKLAMVELAGGLGYRYASASVSGPGRNPWDTTRWTRGWSSGAGGAVAQYGAGFLQRAWSWKAHFPMLARPIDR